MAERVGLVSSHGIGRLARGRSTWSTHRRSARAEAHIDSRARTGSIPHGSAHGADPLNRAHGDGSRGSIDSVGCLVDWSR
jgi:hypothetical protein